MENATRKAVLVSAAILVLALSSLAVSFEAAAAGPVDLDFKWRAGEDQTCRLWPRSGNVEYNLSLAMNGTDSSAIPTPTWVYIDNSTIPTAKADGWSFIMSAGSPPGADPPAFDSTSNSFVSGDNVYTNVGNPMNLNLYSLAHGAPPSNLTIFLTPTIKSENKSWGFDVVAQTHRSGISAQVVKRVRLCVTIPADPKFEMGAKDELLDAAAGATITVAFWLKNIGNTADRYVCNVTVPREDWNWSFLTAMDYFNETNRQNITNQVNISQNITIRVHVQLPGTARAGENSSVSLNCFSIKNPGYFVYPPSTRISVLQFYFVSGQVLGTDTLSGVPGDQLRFDFLVENRGNGFDTFAVGIAQGNVSWEALPTPDTYLVSPFEDPGYMKAGQFIVSIPWGTRIGTQDFTLKVVSQASTPSVSYEYPLRFHVNIKQIFIPFITQPPAQTGTPGQEIVFQFAIGNDGNGLDNFVIYKTELADWRVFLDSPLGAIGKKLLDASEVFTFTATVIVPKDLRKAQVGTYQQSVRITSEYAMQDIGQEIFREINLTVIILPRCQFLLDPERTEKPVNPFESPGGIAESSFLLTVNNTGNGPDTALMTFVLPEGFNVSLSPVLFQIGVFEIKAVLVTIRTPSTIPSGDYTIEVVAVSACNTAATFSAQYKITVYHLDGNINPLVESYIQNPERPQDEVTAPVTQSLITQVEGFIVTFRIRFNNTGDRAIAIGTAVIKIYDDFSCPSPPQGAINASCSPRLLDTWRLDTNLTVRQEKQPTYVYFAPEYLIFDRENYNPKNPQPNVRTIRFVLEMAAQNYTQNDLAQVQVNILPKSVIPPKVVSVGLPVVAIALGAAVAAASGFGVYWRFLRPKKVDEDLYASIYGQPGAQPGQTVDDYFASQGAAQTPSPAQGMTDEQLEEARRLYGDNYGRKR